MSLLDSNKPLLTHDEANLFTILASHAQHQPNKIYLYGAEGNITYQQMHEIACRLGQGLRARLAKAQQPTIAVSLNSGTAVSQLIWACLSAGICLAFLPPTPDPEQIAGFMAQIEADLLVTDVPELEVLSDAVSLKALQQAEYVKHPPPLIQPDTPAFIFQTSGTTGAAKWIQVTHGHYLTAIEGMRHVGSLDHAVNQTVYITPPLSHSYGLSSLLEYSSVGAAVVLPVAGSTLGAVGDLLQARFNQEITALEGVPHFYAQLSRLIKRIHLPNLQHVGFGGGALDREAVQQIQAVHPDLSYSVRYGLTETPSVVSHKLFEPPYEDDWASSGTVLPIYTLRIAGEDGETLPAGQPGEIHLKGESLAWPYYGETAVSDCFATGDIGYINANTQELYIVGRQSSFLKVKGYRLSPEYIESIIGAYAGVLDCRVSGMETGILAEVVVANTSMTSQPLLAFLAERLPSYAVPETVTFVPAIPRTHSGKIKRH